MNIFKSLIIISSITIAVTGTANACFYKQNIESVKAHGAGPINFTLGNGHDYTLMDNSKSDGGKSEYKLLLLGMATGMKISGSTDSKYDCDNYNIKSLTLHKE